MSERGGVLGKLRDMEKRATGKVSAPVDLSAPAPAQQIARVIQLPLWPEAVRGVPNGILRSALFGAIRKGRRAYLKGAQIAAVDGVSIRYTGERLDQGDLDVWESVLHAVRAQEMGSQCRVTSYALLKLMGKTDTGKNRQTLHKRLTRLRASAVEIRQGQYLYIGGLLAGAAKDEHTQEWVIEIDAKLRPLYARDQFTQIDWDIRHALDGKPLAQWLHGFYASHARPFPVRAETLLELSGSENDEARSSRQKLRKALDAVAEACKAHGERFGYQLEGDLVHVARTPSRSQQNHLNKQKAKPK